MQGVNRVADFCDASAPDDLYVRTISRETATRPVAAMGRTSIQRVQQYPLGNRGQEHRQQGRNLQARLLLGYVDLSSMGPGTAGIFLCSSELDVNFGSRLCPNGRRIISLGWH